MAPISPDSLKRSSPSSPSGDEFEERSSKRRRMEPTMPQTPPPEVEEEGPPPESIPPGGSFNDDPTRLLQRSIALALKHVGFDSATKEAMDAMCGEVEIYATRFLSQITTSMLNARRAQPIPTDFQYALQKFDLPLASLRPHLKPPIPAAVTQIQLEAEPAEPASTKEFEKRITQLLGKELSGEIDRRNKPYIPKKFIPFPSRHTYAWTEPEPKNQKDRRKIREEAAKVSRQAEEALRRFINVGKTAKEKGLKSAASRDPTTKKTHQLWENVMASMAKLPQASRKSDEDQSMTVNAESQYFRKGVPAKKKGSMPTGGVQKDE